MATVNLGRIKPIFKGAYAGGTAYVVDDIVTSGNETFICILASTGNATSNATYWTKLASKGADGSNGSNGTDLSTTLTTQGDILYRDGSGLQRLAKGTANQELRINSGATAPEWHTPAVASSDYVLLSTVTASSTSVVSFDGFFSSTYKNYQIRFSGVSPVTNNQAFYFRVRQGNNDMTGASDYYWVYHGMERNLNTGDAGISGGGGGSSASRFFHGAALSSDTTYNLNGVLELYNPLETAFRIFRTECVFHGDSTSYMKTSTGMLSYRGNTSPLSGVSFYMASGSIQQGSFKLYGIK